MCSASTDVRVRLRILALRAATRPRNACRARLLSAGEEEPGERDDLLSFLRRLWAREERKEARDADSERERVYSDFFLRSQDVRAGPGGGRQGWGREKREVCVFRGFRNRELIGIRLDRKGRLPLLVRFANRENLTSFAREGRGEG